MACDADQNAAVRERDRRLRLAVLWEKRQAAIALRDANEIDDIVLRELQAAMDVEEVRLLGPVTPDSAAGRPQSVNRARTALTMVSRMPSSTMAKNAGSPLNSALAVLRTCSPVRCGGISGTAGSTTASMTNGRSAANARSRTARSPGVVEPRAVQAQQLGPVGVGDVGQACGLGVGVLAERAAGLPGDEGQVAVVEHEHDEPPVGPASPSSGAR